MSVQFLLIHHKFCPDADIGWVSTVKDEDFEEAVRKVAGGIETLLVLIESLIPMILHLDQIIMSTKLRTTQSKPTQYL